MDSNEILTRIKDLEEYIATGAFLAEARTAREWGGADVTIKSTLTPLGKAWLGDQPSVISLQETEPGKRAVITTYSKELSCLFDKLKEIFHGHVDDVSKFDFYGSLAQGALKYLEQHKNDVNCLDLLKSVTGQARAFVEYRLPGTTQE